MADGPKRPDGDDKPDSSPERPPEPPPPPFPPEEVRDLYDSEVLRFGLGRHGARRSVGIDTAGASLSALNDTIRVLAADKFGNLRERGPVPTPSDFEPLQLVDAVFASTVFYFSPGGPQELQLDAETQAGSSPTAARGRLEVRRPKRQEPREARREPGVGALIGRPRGGASGGRRS